MALGSITIVNRGVRGNRRTRTVDIVGPASYTAGGELFAPADLGLQNIDACLLSSVRTASGASFKRGVHDPVNGKLMLSTVAGAEETAATDLSTFTYRFLIEGV